MNDAERAALLNADTGEGPRLAASAHVLGMTYGVRLERREVLARYKAQALRLQPPGPGKDES